MTKTALIMAIALGAITITGVILSLVAPKRISIISKQFVQGSRQQVYDQLRYMRNFPKWSPFLVQDPDQKFEVSGTDGEIGATFTWEGVRQKSKGEQKIVDLKENEEVTVQCNIKEPFHASPEFSYTLRDSLNGVEVIQYFEVEMPFPANIFGLVFNLKSKMAQTNEEGLALLKKQIEGENLTQSLN